MNCDNETIPCRVCGNPTKYLATKLCDWCYEVESYVDHYLRSETGRKLMAETLLRSVNDDTLERLLVIDTPNLGKADALVLKMLERLGFDKISSAYKKASGYFGAEIEALNG